MDIVIEGLRLSRGGRSVIDIPSLRFASQQTTAILGPNGAGKTTLLRLIAALERPTEGRVVVGGEAMRDDSRSRRQLAFVFQQPVFLRASVRENLELGLRLRGVERVERQARIDEAAALLGVGPLLSRAATTLSEGEGRRASLARALCLQAPLLLLDEPLAGLDDETHARLLNELPGILRARGATTLLVTHDRQEAERLGQRVVILRDGRVADS